MKKNKILKALLYFCSEFLGIIIIGCVAGLTIISVHNSSQKNFCDFAVEKDFYKNTQEDRLQCSSDYLNYVIELIKKGNDFNE